MTNTALSHDHRKKVVDLNMQEIPTDISTELIFYVYTEEHLQKLIKKLPDGTTPKHKGKIIPFVRMKFETEDVPAILSIKQCIYPQCKRLFLSAGSSHRKCHHTHKQPMEKLY